MRAIKRYVKSARIEAKILDYIFDKQKELNVNLCVKMYSHFKLYGEGGIRHVMMMMMILMMVVLGCMFILMAMFIL